MTVGPRSLCLRYGRGPPILSYIAINERRMTNVDRNRRTTAKSTLEYQQHSRYPTLLP
jgi:hypothetical protein